MSKTQISLLIVCLLSSAFEDCADAFIRKRRTFAPSTDSVNFWRSHYKPYPSSGEQSPEQSTPLFPGPHQEAAHTSTNENLRDRKIPAYLYKGHDPWTHQAEMAHWPPQEQGASHSRAHFQTSVVNGSPQNVQVPPGFTGTRQMKVLSQPSSPDDLIRPPASGWAWTSQYGSSLMEKPSTATTDQSVNGYQFKTKTSNEALQSAVQPGYDATLTPQRTSSGLEVHSGVSAEDEASKSIHNNFPPSTQHNPVVDIPSLYGRMQPALSRLSLTRSDDSPSVDSPGSSSNMNPQDGAHYQMRRFSHSNGAPSSQEEFLSQPSQPKAPGVLNHGSRSRYQPVARRYSFGQSDVASSVPSHTLSPSPGGESLPDRFATHPWDDNTRDAALGPERLDLMAPAYKAGQSTNINPLYRANPLPHRGMLAPTVDDVQLSRRAIEEPYSPAQRKSIPEKHFVKTIYEYPSVFKKYGFGKKRATDPAPVRSHFQKTERPLEHSGNKDTMIHQSNEYNVKLSTYIEEMPFKYRSTPKETPIIASSNQSVNTKHPSAESEVQPVSGATQAPSKPRFVVNPHLWTRHDAKKIILNRFPHLANPVKMDPVIPDDNTHNQRAIVTPSSGSSASGQREGTVSYHTDLTSLLYRENVSDELGETQTHQNSAKPGSMPIGQPINDKQLSIMPNIATASPALEQSTAEPGSDEDIFSQREAALGIYRPRRKKPKTSVVHGPKTPPNSIKLTQNSSELPAPQTRMDPNAQPVATATDPGTPTGMPPDALAVKSPASVQQTPVTQTATTELPPTLYDVLNENPTSTLVRGTLVKDKLPMAQNHDSSFTSVRTHFPSMVGVRKDFDLMSIQFADIVGGATFSGITPEKRLPVDKPMTRKRSTTHANQKRHAKIPAPIRTDLSSRGTFFSVGRGGPRGASGVPRQEGHVDA